MMDNEHKSMDELIEENKLLKEDNAYLSVEASKATLIVEKLRKWEKTLVPSDGWCSSHTKRRIKGILKVKP